MKRSLLIIGLLIVVIIIFEPFRSEPPTPKILGAGTEIPTTQGSFCWDGLLLAQCVDTAHTTPLDMTKTHNPTVVSKNEEIKIRFRNGPPPETIKVEQWIDENHVKNIEITNEKINVPSEKGVYAYHVIADWKQGDGNYAFLIEVE